MNTIQLQVRTANRANLPAIHALFGDFLKLEASQGWKWRDAIAAANSCGTVVNLDETPLGRFLNSEVSEGNTWGGAIEEALETRCNVSFPYEAYGAFLAREAASTSGSEGDIDTSTLPAFLTGTADAEDEDEGIDGETIKFWLRDLRVDRILNVGRRARKSVTVH